MSEPSQEELDRLQKIAQALAAQGEEHFDCVYIVCGKKDRIFTAWGGCYFGAHQILQLQAGEVELGRMTEDGDDDDDDGEEWKKNSGKKG